jgi:uncharacterized membrane protein YfcA
MPLVLVSAPLAYLGGLTPIKQATFIAILGLSLFVAGVLLLVQRSRAAEVTRKTTSIGDATLGGAVGYLSGLVGIGGGIFLSPLQHLMNWAVPRQIAATASGCVMYSSPLARICPLCAASLKTNACSTRSRSAGFR